MSDEEDFEELPSIIVNSSLHESSSFSMPSAETVAAARARAAATERSLLQLRAELAGARGSRSESSGSEGEAALAAAVQALRVRPARCRPARLPCALPALAPHLPPDTLFVAAYLEAVRDGSEATVHALTHELNAAVRDMVVEASAAPGPGPLSAEEALGAGAWLCAAAAGGFGGARRETLRALHLLIDHVATDQQVEAIAALLSASSLEEAAALELSDALRSGGARGEALARAVARGALASLAGLSPAQERSMRCIACSLPGAWRRLPAPRQYLALQLLARLLPGAEETPGELRALLDALSQAAPAQRTQSTDTLKVLVAATKLQVLFHLKK